MGCLAKQLASTCALLLCVEVAVGQGTIQFGNNFGSGATGFRAPIYNADPNAPTCPQVGQSPIGNPSGNTVYAGALLQGTGFTFALFAGPAGAAESALQLVTTTTFRTASGNVIPAGLVNTVTVSIPGVGPGQIASLQIRVWDNQGGTIATWAQVLGTGGGTVFGKTHVFNSAPLGGPNPDPTEPLISPPELRGWTSFSLGLPAQCVPEPSTLALGMVGCLALLIRGGRRLRWRLLSPPAAPDKTAAP